MENLKAHILKLFKISFFSHGLGGKWAKRCQGLGFGNQIWVKIATSAMFQPKVVMKLEWLLINNLSLFSTIHALMFWPKILLTNQIKEFNQQYLKMDPMDHGFLTCLIRVDIVRKSLNLLPLVGHCRTCPYMPKKSFKWRYFKSFRKLIISFLTVFDFYPQNRVFMLSCNLLHSVLEKFICSTIFEEIIHHFNVCHTNG